MLSTLAPRAPARRAARSPATAPSRFAPDWRWLYLLGLVPALVELIETGSLPASPREASTEILLGLLLVGVARLVAAQGARLAALAETDGLTGLLNARRFQLDLPRELLRARRQGRPLSLACLDLDDLKALNDSHGHDAGDEVLRRIGEVLSDGVRRDVDLAYRLGGDEFAVLLPDVDARDAREIVERLRRRLQATSPIPAGLSAGVAEVAEPDDASSLRRRADRLLYDAKSAGKGRVVAQVRGG